MFLALRFRPIPRRLDSRAVFSDAVEADVVD